MVIHDPTVPVDLERWARLAEQVLEAEGVRGNAELSVLFIGRDDMAELNEDMVSLNWDTAKRIEGLSDFREGLFMNYREGIYHLTYSIDDTGSPNYRVGYATAPSPEGPFTYRGVILEKDESQGILGTGHNSVLNVPDTDEWYIAYHRFAIPNGGGTNRETKLDKLFFDSETGFIKPVVPTLQNVEPFTIPGCDVKCRRHWSS